MYDVWYMLFGIWSSKSRTRKFWHTCVITYSDFMAIVEPWKQLKISLFYTGVPNILLIWSTYSSWHIERYKLKLVGNPNSRSFLPIHPPKTSKNQNFAKWKILVEISSFYTCAQKITIIWCMVWYMEWDRQNFVAFWTILCPFTPLTIPKIKIWNKEKTPADLTGLH